MEQNVDIVKDNQSQEENSISAPEPVATLSKQRVHNMPFRRVKAEEFELQSDFGDNSFEAKSGARNDWGAKANQVLSTVRGKNFRHEKTKKKRGTYRGGKIDISAVKSIKFED